MASCSSHGAWQYQPASNFIRRFYGCPLLDAAYVRSTFREAAIRRRTRRSAACRSRRSAPPAAMPTTRPPGRLRASSACQSCRFGPPPPRCTASTRRAPSATARIGSCRECSYTGVNCSRTCCLAPRASQRDRSTRSRRRRSDGARSAASSRRSRVACTTRTDETRTRAAARPRAERPSCPSARRRTHTIANFSKPYAFSSPSWRRSAPISSSTSAANSSKCGRSASSPLAPHSTPTAFMPAALAAFPSDGLSPT